jgi:hypothetical protein
MILNRQVAKAAKKAKHLDPKTGRSWRLGG